MTIQDRIDRINMEIAECNNGIETAKIRLEKMFYKLRIKRLKKRLEDIAQGL